MSIIEKIREKYPLENYIIEKTGFHWKDIGTWKNLEPECCICSGHDCGRLSPSGNFYCFQCFSVAKDAIAFRSLFENISYKEAIDKFKNELGIKEYDKKDIDWVSLRESSCEYLREVLFTCQTKYDFRGQKWTPLHYLTDFRKHSYEAILNFRIGFNDGTLIDHLKKEFSKEVIKASGLEFVPAGSFVYPFIVNNEIKYFRIKDPNKINKFQMPSSTRSKSAIWYNQDVLKEGREIWICEGEDNIISLWDCGVDAIASCGTLTMTQINYLKTFNLNCVYTCFDADQAGKRNTDILIKSYDNENVFVIQVPDGKDIDDLIRDTEKKEDLIQDLKTGAVLPAPEMRSIVKQKNDGYYIDKNYNGVIIEKRLTNWVLVLEAVIIKSEDERFRKCKLKSNGYETTIYMPSEVFASTMKLREFLCANSNKLLYFTGTENDLTSLVQFLDIVFKPKIVIESDCVGDIKEGFISENIFISNIGEFKPLINSFLELDNNQSIKIVDLIVKGGDKSEIPYFPLTEPSGGINEFKKYVFQTMIKNRNLKVALAIGWLKAVLWSKMFYEKKRYFPLLMLHGKYAGGKTKLSEWLMSMVGLRDCNPEVLSERGTSEVGLARKMAYYSSLPIFVDDYRNDESGQKFHTFFRGIFNRSSPTKGLKDDFGVRRVIIRGCLLLTGETSPTDPALLSRIISIEITKQERNNKYYKELLKLEPNFACIGLDWLKQRNKDFGTFLNEFEELEIELSNEIDDPRQASIWAIAAAGAVTEKTFRKDDLIDFAIKLANYEIEQRKGDEVLGTLWDAVDFLHKKDKMDKQFIDYVFGDRLVRIHLIGLLNEIRSNPNTRHFDLPNHKEVAKLLKQEPYILEQKIVKVDGKVSRRWILDIKECPEVLKNIYEPEEFDRKSDEDNKKSGENVENI